MCGVRVFLLHSPEVAAPETPPETPETPPPPAVRVRVSESESEERGKRNGSRQQVTLVELVELVGGGGYWLVAAYTSPLPSG